MIETHAIYENGVLRPLSPLPLREKQTVAVTIMEPRGWLDDLLDSELIEQCQKDAQDAPTLEEIRAVLASGPGSLSEALRSDRNESRY
jgi:predicted DNA-binding antitoxin AbrB/MazE fold protein